MNKELARKGSRETEATPSAVLLALAERCEREGPSRELDVAIAGWFSQNDYTWWRGRVGPSDFTRSLDAAVTLVPSKWWEVDVGGEDRPVAVVTMNERPLSEFYIGHSRTPALALCAAALRARAAVAEGE